MKKKVFISFLCLLFMLSCGKKADPEYKTQKDNIAINMI